MAMQPVSSDDGNCVNSIARAIGEDGVDGVATGPLEIAAVEFASAFI
jgi:predicted dinucleotide-binding enzyme